jgi:rRNA maturation endonuclease Nob1
LDSIGELYRHKKRKVNVSVNDYTYPSPSKAIQQDKFKLNNNFNSEMMQENMSKNLAMKNVTNNHDVSNDITNVSSNNITLVTISL